MRIFVAKGFDRFQRRERITDAMLCKAIAAASRGLVDANLGAELIKQRIARARQGKRGGYRAFVAVRDTERAVFLYGFAKSQLENIRPDQLAELKLYASRWLGMANDAIERAVADGDLREVLCDEAGKKA